jgi:hypothetical protein
MYAGPPFDGKDYEDVPNLPLIPPVPAISRIPSESTQKTLIQRVLEDLKQLSIEERELVIKEIKILNKKELEKLAEKLSPEMLEYLQVQLDKNLEK